MIQREKEESNLVRYHSTIVPDTTWMLRQAAFDGSFSTATAMEPPSWPRSRHEEMSSPRSSGHARAIAAVVWKFRPSQKFIKKIYLLREKKWN